MGSYFSEFSVFPNLTLPPDWTSFLLPGALQLLCSQLQMTFSLKTFWSAPPAHEPICICPVSSFLPPFLYYCTLIFSIPIALCPSALPPSSYVDSWCHLTGCKGLYVGTPAFISLFFLTREAWVQLPKFLLLGADCKLHMGRKCFVFCTSFPAPQHNPSTDAVSAEYLLRH